MDANKKGSGISDVKAFQRWMLKEGPVSGRKVIENALCMHKEPHVREALARDPAISQLWASVSQAIAAYKDACAKQVETRVDTHAMGLELAKLAEAVKVASILSGETKNAMLATTQAALDALVKPLDGLKDADARDVLKRAKKLGQEIARLSSA